MSFVENSVNENFVKMTPNEHSANSDYFLKRSLIVCKVIANQQFT